MWGVYSLLWYMYVYIYVCVCVCVYVTLDHKTCQKGLCIIWKLSIDVEFVRIGKYLPIQLFEIIKY